MLPPLVSVIFALMLMSCAAQISILPSVVVIAAFMLTLCPAPNKALPLTVVMAAFTLTSRPQQATKFPLVALMAAFTFTSRSALNVSVVGLELAVQLTGCLTLISPLPGVAVFSVLVGGVPGVVESEPVVVLMVTLLVTNKAERVAPEILSVDKPPMLKSCGSMSQLPVNPWGAAVVILASLAIFTCAAEVSMKPPLPPWGADASIVPPTLTLPLCMLASSLIVPL